MIFDRANVEDKYKERRKELRKTKMKGESLRGFATLYAVEIDDVIFFQGIFWCRIIVSYIPVNQTVVSKELDIYWRKASTPKIISYFS